MNTPIIITLIICGTLIVFDVLSMIDKKINPKDNEEEK